MDRRFPSIYWFSQTLGNGRRLEDLIAALPLLKHEAEIHLRGKPVSGFEKWLSYRTPEAWRGRIMVHGLVSNAELLSRISEHDIGFAGETPLIRSRDLTVTNKILFYLLAGLAVVASETGGQREVASQAPSGVFLYRPGDASALARVLMYSRLGRRPEEGQVTLRRAHSAGNVRRRLFKPIQSRSGAACFKMTRAPTRTARIGSRLQNESGIFTPLRSNCQGRSDLS
jgi:glycosyltransferase involved in cell wall biosynthesis